MEVRQIMIRDIITISLDDSLLKVQELFEEHGFHHLLVVDKEKVVGVLSDRDLLLHLSPFINKLSERVQDVQTLNRRVHQIMSYNPITVSPETRVENAAQVMLEHKVSCLPVVSEDGLVMGVVTWRDLLKGLCSLLGA